MYENIGSLVPIILMVGGIAVNQAISHQRAEKKAASESSRFQAALGAELHALLGVYELNLDCLSRRVGNVLSGKSVVHVYKGNLGRLATLLDRPVIEHVVTTFAQNERIDAFLTAHATPKGGSTFQIQPDAAYIEELTQMYSKASQAIARACDLLAGRDPPRRPIGENAGSDLALQVPHVHA